MSNEAEEINRQTLGLKRGSAQQEALFDIDEREQLGKVQCHQGKSEKAEEMHRHRTESDGAWQGVSFDVDEHG
jgi:hypothetical protein